MWLYAVRRWELEVAWAYPNNVIPNPIIHYAVFASEPDDPFAVEAFQSSGYLVKPVRISLGRASEPPVVLLVFATVALSVSGFHVLPVGVVRRWEPLPLTILAVALMGRHRFLQSPRLASFEGNLTVIPLSPIAVQGFRDLERRVVMLAGNDGDVKVLDLGIVSQGFQGTSISRFFGWQ